MDELHLQRGAAGTEVAYLLRLLFERLGLAEPSMRHKVRILASSASLPTEGEHGAQSRRFLWDMFGNFGGCRPEEANPTDSYFWDAAIVTGDAEPEISAQTHVLPARPFADFASAHRALAHDIAIPMDPGSLSDEWHAVHKGLGLHETSDFGELTKSAIEEAGRRVAIACWSDTKKRPRATPLAELALTLFGEIDGSSELALRGLLILRGAGDWYRNWISDSGLSGGVSAPSFRLHTFVRSIEGMYAPVDCGASADTAFKSQTRKIGRLSIERAAVSSGPKNGGASPKQVEVLYCECCGAIAVGGMRRQNGTSVTELLPFDPDLDGLPDSSRSRLFEDLSYDDYALFWPSDVEAAPKVAGDPKKSLESWIPALIDAETAVVSSAGLSKQQDDRHRISGWLLRRQ